MAELLGIETYATSDAYTVGEAVTSTWLVCVRKNGIPRRRVIKMP